MIISEYEFYKIFAEHFYLERFLYRVASVEYILIGALTIRSHINTIKTRYKTKYFSAAGHVIICRFYIKLLR